MGVRRPLSCSKTKSTRKKWLRSSPLLGMARATSSQGCLILEWEPISVRAAIELVVILTVFFLFLIFFS